MHPFCLKPQSISVVKLLLQVLALILLRGDEFEFVASGEEAGNTPGGFNKLRFAPDSLFRRNKGCTIGLIVLFFSYRGPTSYVDGSPSQIRHSSHTQSTGPCGRYLLNPNTPEQQITSTATLAFFAILIGWGLPLRTKLFTSGDANPTRRPRIHWRE